MGDVLYEFDCLADLHKYLCAESVHSAEVVMVEYPPLSFEMLQVVFLVVNHWLWTKYLLTL